MTYKPTMKDIISFIDNSQLTYIGDNCEKTECCGICDDVRTISKDIKSYYERILLHCKHFPLKKCRPETLHWYLELGELLGLIVRIKD